MTLAAAFKPPTAAAAASALRRGMLILPATLEESTGSLTDDSGTLRLRLAGAKRVGADARFLASG